MSETSEVTAVDKEAPPVAPTWEELALGTRKITFETVGKGPGGCGSGGELDPRDHKEIIRAIFQALVNNEVVTISNGGSDSVYKWE
jgi:hypothetical protein